MAEEKKKLIKSPSSVFKDINGKQYFNQALMRPISERRSSLNEVSSSRSKEKKRK
jgi:hypothetical protein